MKNDIIIKKLEDNYFLSDLVIMHREIFENTEFYGKLIYFDSAFPNYLENILIDKRHYFFAIIYNDNICGFLHLKEVGSNLFLNNIYLNKLVRGGGIGTYVLNYVLNHPLINRKFVNIELDVLGSNTIARKWYQKIGLNTEFISYWYYVHNLNLNDLSFHVGYDENNFLSLLFEDVKVATIIRNTCIIAHNELALSYKSHLPFIFKTDKISDNIGFENFDSSIRMKGNIINIIKCISLK